MVNMLANSCLTPTLQVRGKIGIIDFGVNFPFKSLVILMTVRLYFDTISQHAHNDNAKIAMFS